MRGKERRPRPGFTLLELLVVVSIIAVILLLSGAAAIRLMGATATSATRTTLDRLGIRLNAQMAAVRDKPARDAIPPNILTLAGNDQDRARVIYIKLKLKQAFPTSYYEVFYPAGDAATGTDYLRPIDKYQRTLEQAGITRGSLSAQPLAHESAACLHMALRYGPDGHSDDDTGMAGAVKQVGGMPVLVDAWSIPLVFCRWPVGNNSGASIVNPGGLAAAVGLEDSGDPRGTLNDATTWAGRGTFQGVGHLLRTSSGKSLNLSPVLFSCGADKKAGVNLLTLESTGVDSNDNIIGSRVK